MSVIGIFSAGLSLASLQTYGYPLVFILNVLEGPIVTYFAAFAASLGVFNVFYIFLISLIGNFISDFAAFLIGKVGRKTFLHRLISKPKYVLLNSLKHHFEKNTSFSIGMIKLALPLAAPGLVFAGMSNLSFKKFTPVVLLMGIPFALFFTIAGYYSGIAYLAFANYIKIGEIAILIAAVIFILIWFAYRKFSAYVVKRVEAKA
jgi:membrane protein DedA with SNARE-associated domain